MHSSRYDHTTLTNKDRLREASLGKLVRYLLTTLPDQLMHSAFSAFDIQFIKGDKEIKHNLQPRDWKRHLQKDSLQPQWKGPY